MKTSLKQLITGISVIGLGFTLALPSMAQSRPTNVDRDSTAPQSGSSRPGSAAPNAETTSPTSPQTPAPTNRDTGIPPVGGSQRDQSAPGSQSMPSGTMNNGTMNNGTMNNGTMNPGVPNNQSVPGVVSPANRPENNNLPNGSAPTRGTTSTSSPSSSYAGSEGKTIDQIVRTSPSFELFNALLRVADSNANGGFSASLASGDYTVFAPTDEALAAIPPATFKALVQPENRALLAQVLENHIVRGKVTSNDLAAKEVKSMGGSAIMAQGGSGNLMIGNARILGSDIQASNGIIHAVDQVLLPANVQSKLTSLAPQASMPMSQP